MSKTAQSRQSYGNGHLFYHCSCYFLARALVCDVACEDAPFRCPHDTITSLLEGRVAV